MLNGKACIKRQEHLELPLFKEEGTLREVWAGIFLLEANWQSPWKEARNVILFPASDIDFNTNGDLNWTLNSLQNSSLWSGSHGLDVQVSLGCALWLCSKHLYLCPVITVILNIFSLSSSALENVVLL